MFTNAIVRKPCRNLVNGLTSAGLGKPDYYLAAEQHKKYIEILEGCGLDVTVLDPDENYPDSVFVEDTALLISGCAIITNPGAVPRKGEIFSIYEALKKFYTNFKFINAPGTLEAGDGMMVEDHCYIGLSERTNLSGADQLTGILSEFGITGSTVSLENILHLKSGISYLGGNDVLITSPLRSKPDFRKYRLIDVDDEESYAANSLRINNLVLVPEGNPKTKNKIETAGHRTVEVDVSEFRKLDGGLSCLSLRF